MKKIDLTTWNRKEIYELFSKVDYPFYSITIPIDVTKVKEVSKNKQQSFYYLLIWLVTKALQSVEEFKIQIIQNELFVSDTLYPSFTSMKKGEEIFQIISMNICDSYEIFCDEARKHAESQTTLFGTNECVGTPIYFSSTPWFDFTALSNERNFDKDDTIPRIAWGQYYQENDRLMIHLSIDCNHRTIDGIHIGKFKKVLDELIQELN